MIRRWTRRLLLAAIGLGALIAIAHAPAVRAWVLEYGSAAIGRRTGLEVSASRLSYNLLTRTVSIDGLVIAARDAGRPPMVRVDHASAVLSSWFITGLPAFESLTADGISVRVDLDGRAASTTAAAMPALLVGRAVLTNVDVEIVDRAGIGVVSIRDADFDLRGSGDARFAGSFAVSGGIALDNADVRLRVDRVEGRLSLGAMELTLRPSLVVVGGERIAAGGTITLGGGSPGYDATLTGRLAAGAVSAWFPSWPPVRGSVDLSAHVTGAPAHPRVTFDGKTAGLEWPAFRLPPTRVSGELSRGGVTLARATISVGAGTLAGQGFVPFSGDRVSSRVTVSLDHVRTADLVKSFPAVRAPSPAVTLSGSAELSWRGATPSLASLRGHAGADISVADGVAPIHADLAAEAGGWRLRAHHQWDAGTSATLDATLAIDPRDTGRTPVGGTLEVSATDAADLLARLRAIDPRVPELPGWIARTPVAVTATLAGTLADPRVGGTLDAPGIDTSGLGTLSLTSEFRASQSALSVPRATITDAHGNRADLAGSVDLVRSRTTGTASATLRDPLALAGSPVGDLRLVGSVTADVSWDGPLGDPSLTVRARASGLTISSPGMAADGVAVEATADGPLSALRATARATAAAVRAGDRALGTLTADLGLEDGRATVNASAPAIAATLHAEASTAEPRAYSATLLLADSDLRALMPATSIGERVIEPAGAISARIDASGSLDDRTLALGGQVTVSGGALVLDGATISDAVAARIDVRDGRVEVSALKGTLLRGPLEASASVPLDWAAGLLPEGWRLVTAGPSRPGRVEVHATPTLEALAQALGLSDAGDASTALPLQLSLEASAPELHALGGRATAGPLTFRAGGASYGTDGPARFELAEGIVRLLPATLTGPRTTMTLAGRIGLEGAHDLSAELNATGSLRILSAFLPGRFSGSVDARVSASGSMADPRMNGSISIDGGSWIWSAQRLAVTEWSGTSVLENGTVTIQGLKGQVNGGAAEITGSFALGKDRPDAAPPRLDLSVRDAFVEVVPGLATQLDAQISLAPATAGALVSGTVTATSGSYREPLLAMAKLLAPQASRATAAQRQAASQQPGLLSSIALDVALAATTPIIVENSAGRVDLLPDLRIGGTLEAPSLTGSLNALDDGRLMLAGRTYRLREGRVVFPAGAGAPRVELIGETQIGSYAVTLRTDGPADELEMTYTADPPLGERDIRSLLVTGRVSDVTGSSTAEDDRFAIGAASSDLLGMAGQLVGLDSVQLGRGDFELGSSDVNPAMRLTVTKSLRSNFRVVLSQNLDDNKFTWIVIVDTKRNAQFRFSQRDNNEQVVEFRQEVEFGPGVSRVPPTRTGGGTPRSTVSTLLFTGAPGIPEPDLRSVLKQTPGQAFEMREWQRDHARLQQLYRERGYETALVVPSRTATGHADAQKVALTYRIDRGPRTVLRVTGLDVPADVLGSLMRVWGRAMLPEFVRDDLQRFMTRYLADLGYLRGEVTVQIDQPDDTVAVASIVVTPGPRSASQAVVFSGSAAVPERDLRAGLTERGLLDQAWTDPAPAVAAILEFYAQRGYMASTVVPGPVRFVGDSAELPMRITEGPLSTFAAVRVTGVPDVREGAVRAASGVSAGEVCLPGTDREAARRVERYYRSQGFLSAAVQPAVSFDAASQASLTIAVTEGPQSIVRAVEVSGVEATNQSLVDGAITLKPGAPASQAGASDTQKRLYSLGVFRRADVRFDPVTPGLGGVEGTGTGAATVPVDAVVTLQESRRFLLRYGVQASNKSGSFLSNPKGAFGVSGDISDRNFLGRGFTLGASGRFEWRLKSVRGLFALPRMFGDRLQSTIYTTWRSETRDLGDTITLADRQRNVSFEQRWRLSRRMDLSWGYTYNRQFVTLASETVTDLPPFGGTLAGLNTTLVTDTRDSVFDATRGFFQSTNAQWGLRPLGSEFGYIRLLLRQFYYQRAGPLVLASGVRWGMLRGLAGTPPLTVLDLLFGAGGSQTVRGYAEDSLSAITVFGVPAGGPDVLLLNQEVRFPIFGWLGGAAFIDAGNTFAETQAVSLNGLALGAGVGLRIQTPIAPLRFDLAWPINPRPGDKPWRLYFSIGQIF